MPSAVLDRAQTSQSAELIESAAAMDWDRAARILRAMPCPLPAEALRAAAETALHQQEWKQAGKFLDAIVRPDFACQMRRFLALNLADLQEYRPEIYSQVLQSTAPTNRPVDEDLQVRPILKSGVPVALLGIGNGECLSTLARYPQNGKQQVYIFESDPAALLIALCRHDFSGPKGPIQSKRFHWFVGSGWADEFRRALQSDSSLSFPETKIALSSESSAIEAELRTISIHNSGGNLCD